MNIQLIEKMIEEGYISKRKHPTRELYILNYTSKAQVDRVWNEATIMCRGLIVTDKWTIVGRPFKKFFTLDQLSAFGLRSKCYHLYDKMKFSEIWNYKYMTFDKMDGSMGIIYQNPWTEQWELASRGSFQSEQAVKGNELLKQELYRKDMLMHGYTYIVEIIYPENRIVVNYGDKEELTLLAAIDNVTGQDDWAEFESMRKVGWPVPKFHRDLTFLTMLEAVEQDKNDEGFVLCAPNGFRLKFKFDEYLRLHKILTNVTARNVWERLRDGIDINDWLVDVPDEFYTWIKRKESELRHMFYDVEVSARRQLSLALKVGRTRKEVAEFLAPFKNKKLVFLMLDDKDYAHVIWGMIKPGHEKPFAFEEEENG